MSERDAAAVGPDPAALFDEVPMRNVPAGLRARVRRQLRAGSDGAPVEVRDRRGRTKLHAVYLFSAEIDAAVKPTVADLTFLLGAGRRAWSTVIDRYGDETRAWERACELARHGAIEIECRVDGFTIGEPVCWQLTERWERRRKQRATSRANEKARWRQRAETAARGMAGRYPQLAHALLTESGPVVRSVLVHAAEDLLSHRTHHGPRAFSQAHFGTTKVRDDVGRILIRCEVETEAQIELGVVRAGRNGFGGPIELRTTKGGLSFRGIRGPTDVRLDQPELRLTCDTQILVVVENRQAAEAVSDHRPDVALFWTAGFMGREGLGALRQLAVPTPIVIACPDADLGGVRIAEQVLAVAPHAEILDIGAWPHLPRPRWKPASTSMIGLRAAEHGPARHLARACLERGYPVEQELAAVDALRDVLTRHAQRPGCG